MGNTTKLRDELLRELSGIRQENEARIGDPYFSSSTGYNMAAWAEKGYEQAMMIVGINFPKEEESVAEYAARLKRLLEVKQGEYVNDNADEDGGAAGALTDALMVLERLDA